MTTAPAPPLIAKDARSRAWLTARVVDAHVESVNLPSACQVPKAFIARNARSRAWSTYEDCKTGLDTGLLDGVIRPLENACMKMQGEVHELQSKYERVEAKLVAAEKHIRDLQHEKEQLVRQYRVIRLDCIDLAGTVKHNYRIESTLREDDDVHVETLLRQYAPDTPLGAEEGLHSSFSSESDEEDYSDDDYEFDDEERTVCQECYHRVPASCMRYGRRCSCGKCLPCFGLPEGKATHCKECKEQGMVDVKSRT